MAEYIEREALLDKVTALVKWITPIEESRDMFYHDSGWNGATTGASLYVQNAPAADVVAVVRCRDCKHFCPYEGEEHKGDCEELVGSESCVYEDDFCSYGERRESNG